MKYKQLSMQEYADILAITDVTEIAKLNDITLYEAALPEGKTILFNTMNGQCGMIF